MRGFGVAGSRPRRNPPADAAAPALAGRVTSPQEGAMEGVLVSAQRDGSPITITVVTDAAGRYAFPADRLAARPLCAAHPRGRL